DADVAIAVVDGIDAEPVVAARDDASGMERNVRCPVIIGLDRRDPETLRIDAPDIETKLAAAQGYDPAARFRIAVNFGAASAYGIGRDRNVTGGVRIDAVAVAAVNIHG